MYRCNDDGDGELAAPKEIAELVEKFNANRALLLLTRLRRRERQERFYRAFSFSPWLGYWQHIQSHTPLQGRDL
jgi:hypothetical protein